MEGDDERELSLSTLKTFIANAKDANIIKCALLSIKQYSFWNDDYIFSELAGLDNVANMIFEDTEKNLGYYKEAIIARIDIVLGRALSLNIRDCYVLTKLSKKHLSKLLESNSYESFWKAL